MIYGPLFFWDSVRAIWMGPTKAQKKQTHSKIRGEKGPRLPLISETPNFNNGFVQKI